MPYSNNSLYVLRVYFLNVVMLIYTPVFWLLWSRKEGTSRDIASATRLLHMVFYLLGQVLTKKIT